MGLRKHKKRVRILLVVLGSICLVIAALLGFSALFRYENEQAKFYRLALIYVLSGVAILAIHFLVFILPELLSRRNSGAYKRRRRNSRDFQRALVPPARNDGSILVFALVLLGIISTLAVHTLMSARALHAETSALLRREQLKSAALDSAHAAMQIIADDNPMVDHFEEPWAIPVETEDPAGITRRVRVTDLQSFFDLNNLAVPVTGNAWPPSAVLADIMTSCGFFTPGNAVEALRDWIDQDDRGSYESNHYQRKTPPYKVADGLLADASDLFDIEGWVPDMFRRKEARSNSMFNGDLVDAVTVIPGERTRVIPVNINTASPDTLIGMFGIGSEGIVERVMVRRKERPILNFDFLSRQVDPEIFNRLSAYIDIRSSWFMIEASAYLEGVSSQIELIAYRHEDGKVDVVKSFFK
jgi:type II secretory pathway component PulK